MPPGLPSMSAALAVNTMDLTTLITACTLTVDPNVMHALTWHQSGGEPWAFSVSGPGQHHPQVLKSMEDAVRAARDTQPNTVVIRVGLTGLPGAPRSVTATMFTPCSNIASAARWIAQLVELCKASTRSKGDPNRCAHCGLPRIVGAARQRLCRQGSGERCQRRRTRFRDAGRNRKRHRRSQSHITQHDAGDGSIRDAGQ
jgi:hypothetical protein